MKGARSLLGKPNEREGKNGEQKHVKEQRSHVTRALYLEEGYRMETTYHRAAQKGRESR